MMDLNITIDNKYKNKFFIEDNTYYLNENEDYSPIEPLILKKSDSKSLTLVYLNKYQKYPEYTYYSFDNEISIDFDGRFTLYYIVLPTKEWVYNNLNIVNNYSQVYYIHDNKVFQYKTNGDIELNDYSILLELAKSPNIEHNISITETEGFSIYYLQECYINLCKQIFSSTRLSSCDKKNNLNEEFSYKRDLVWMGINVIKYMVDGHQLIEAQRIIEILHGCNGICNNFNQTKSEYYGCGCS